MNEKKRRNLKSSRSLLPQVTDANRNAVLNTIYSVAPVAFDPPGFQRRMRETYPPDKENLGLATLNMMRLHRRSGARKIAICCMPKSGSTFILTSLRRLGRFNFNIGYFHVPYDNPSFVDAVEVENELDEMALLRLEMLGRNTLVHTHTKCAPYTEQMMVTHGYRTIVVQRNIFDCIVSMDDMICKGQVPGFGMFHPPTGYRAMAREDRLALLCPYVGPWYIDFAVTWARTRLKPLLLNYDDDVRGFDEATAEKLRRGLDLQEVPLEDFMQAFQLDNKKQKDHARLNVGVSGRGRDIPQAARDVVRRMADAYGADVDFTGLL